VVASYRTYLPAALSAHYHIFESNDAMRLAADCLFRHFDAPLLQKLGPKTVRAWSRIEILPAEYFHIIKEAVQYKPKKFQPSPENVLASAVESVQKQLATLTVCDAPEAISPKEIEDILQELNGVSAVDFVSRGITVGKCLIIPQFRLNAIFALYSTAASQTRISRTCTSIAASRRSK
jgi:hypothetical protein